MRSIKHMRGVLLALALGVGLSLVPLSSSHAEPAGPGVNARPSTNGMSIYVSKINKTVTLKQYGVAIGSWPASIGANSSEGDKKVEGDKITPSGEFFVCLKNDKSIAYLALGISYPGIDDAKRGLDDGIITQEQHDAIVTAIKAGNQPPWTTPLGGYVEIHGCREPGVSTSGCVAVDNEVMDILWQHCEIGVPITIGP